MMATGAILDASAIDAYLHQSVFVETLVGEAARRCETLYVPSLMELEIKTIHNHWAESQLTELFNNGTVKVAPDLETPVARKVRRILRSSGAWDAAAGELVHYALERHWSVISADPERFARIDRTVVVQEVP